MQTNEDLQTDLRDPRQLRPHPDNPRGEIDPDSPEVVQLAENIQRHGLIQPLVITPGGLILAGHRRRAASIKAGLQLVPVVIRELKVGEFAEEFFLSENGQRQDLSPLEEARAIAALHKKMEKQQRRKVTVADLARRLDLPGNTVSLRLDILELPERVQQLFHVGEIPVNSSRILLKLKQWPDEIEKLADKLVTRQLTARSLETVVTRRRDELQRISDDEARLAREPRLERIKRHQPENHFTPSLTREVVMENLLKANGAKVTLHNVKAVFEATCCNCGMMGTPSVCLSCPLPKFVNGLIGRADGAANA